MACSLQFKIGALNLSRQSMLGHGYDSTQRHTHTRMRTLPLSARRTQNIQLANSNMHLLKMRCTVCAECLCSLRLSSYICHKNRTFFCDPWKWSMAGFYRFCLYFKLHFGVYGNFNCLLSWSYCWYFIQMWRLKFPC